MRIKIFVLLVIILAAGCHKNKATNPTIIGNWIWVKSTGGIANILSTPANTGDWITLGLSNDNTGVEHDNAKIVGFHFTLGRDTARLGNTITWSQFTVSSGAISDSLSIRYIYNFNGDTLILSEDYADGQNRYFVKGN